MAHHWDEDLTRKGNEAKNLKEFVVLQQLEKVSQNAQEIAKYKQKELLNKNQAKSDMYQKRQVELKQCHNKFKKKLTQKFKNREDNVKNMALTRIEEINAKRETNNLRKQEQVQNFESLKKQRQE